MAETDFFMLLRRAKNMFGTQLPRLSGVCGDLFGLPLGYFGPQRLTNNL